MTETSGSTSRTPESRVVARKRGRLSVVWLIPIVAAIVGGWIAVTRILAEGPEITIVFKSADGLEAGKTKIKYNGVEVGGLTKIRLSDDHRSVVATAKMEPDTQNFLVEDTHFWIVSARISGASVTGLGTLVSGDYIGMEIGQSKKKQSHYEALADPPIVTSTDPGRFFELTTPTLGSLSFGTPIFFRHLKVGEIASYKLADDGQSFSIKVFVNEPYDRFVNSTTRFWHASGIDMSLTASGIDVRTESLMSIVVGGLAFETPAESANLPPAAENSTFPLFETRAAAMLPAALNPQTMMLVLRQDVRGLEPGAPVDFRGIRIGEVAAVVAQLDPMTFDFSIRVMLSVDAQRLGVEVANLDPTADRAMQRKKLLDGLVERGVRAQIRSGSLLTGALYVAFDFFPDAPPTTLDWSHEPVVIPTIPGTITQLEDEVSGIVKKINAMPLEQIGNNLNRAIADLDTVLVSANGTVGDANALLAPNSVLIQQLESTLQEVSNAARSLRVLTDYLERQPESLIRGKSGGAK